MGAKRRPNATDSTTDTSTSHATRSTTTAQTVDDKLVQPLLHSPFLPTPSEALLLSVYPVTLLLGSLFSHFSPSLRPPANLSIYSPVHQSFQPSDLAPSYWATKRNVLNVYFVKLGWFWCTLALLLFTLLAARGRTAIDIGLRERRSSDRTPTRLADMDATAARTERDERLRRQYQVLLRYLLATGTWVAATQWCAGAPLIDRLFRATGGACSAIEDELARSADPGKLERLAGAASGAACRSLRGRWAGGLDVSGHVFLLVLGSGMLALETLPVILPWIRGLAADRVVRDGAGSARLAHLDHSHSGDASEWRVPSTTTTTGVETRARAAAARTEKGGLHLKSWGVTAVLGFAGLSWWMLLMTAAFFHTWVEKSAACAAAGAALWVVYFAPRGTGALRRFVGMPGV